MNVIVLTEKTHDEDDAKEHHGDLQPVLLTLLLVLLVHLLLLETILDYDEPDEACDL